MKSVLSIIFMLLFLVGSATFMGCDSEDISDPLSNKKTVRSQEQKKSTDNCIEQCDETFEDSKKTKEDVSKRGKCRQGCF